MSIDSVLSDSILSDSILSNTILNSNQISKMKCSECNKKINITNSITCHCNKLLCYKHRYQTDHKCDFDFKTHDRKILAKLNVKIDNEKVIKI